MIWDEMQRTKINGVELETYDRGSGEPVVFIHGAMGDECAAILKEPALAGTFRLIHYHRRGYGNSESSETPVSVEQQVADCRAVMQHLGVERAHVAGQSGGGAIALQLALDVPDAVRSLALLEPALPSVLDDALALHEAMSEAVSLYEAGDKAGAVETFAEEVCGAEYRTAFDRTLPEGYFDRWVAEVDAVFGDAAAEESWTFTREDASRITQPVLNMTGPILRPISGRPTRQSRSGCRMRKTSSCPTRAMACSRRTRRGQPSTWPTSSRVIPCRAKKDDRQNRFEE